MEYQYEHGHDREFNSVMATVGSLIVGGLIGAAVALLTAPKSGRELRRDLGESATHLGEALSETTHEVYETMRQKVTEIGDEAERMGERVGEQAQRIADDYGRREP